MNLADKRALITGGATRVGRAITLGLADAGAHTIIHYNRSADAAEQTAADVRQRGRKALVVQADLADPDATRALARRGTDHLGGVDVLVHSASPFILASLQETTLEQWRQVTGVLVDSFFLLAQELTPGMVEREEGVLVAILDRGAFDPWPRFLAHGVGKSALWALVRSLAVELAPQVRANGIIPGPVLPPPGYSQRQMDRLAAGTLLERWGIPQDIVEGVLFLVRSNYITGEALFIDGGERWAHRRP